MAPERGTFPVPTQPEAVRWVNLSIDGPPTRQGSP
jgi:hypothetical protein